MKRTALVLSAVALALSANVMAQESPWQVRLRAVHLDPADKSAAIPGLAAADAITVSDKMIPEVDISYFFTPNLAAELILTVPQKHSVYLDGAYIGSFKHLPPTLTLQYHFTPESKISPYVGVGANYTRLGSEKMGGLKLENDSLGFALQAGVDYKLDKHWSLNLDVKKLQIRSDVFDATGAKISKVKVDPLLIGVGVGYRF